MAGAVKRSFIVAGSVLALSGAPVSAQTLVPANPQAALGALQVAPDVTSAYETYHIGPIWFRAGPGDAAIGELISILERAPFDGFAEGPQLASEVQRVVAQARVDPTAKENAEKLLSSAWVRYVQALRRPTPSMTYAYPALEPHGTRADEILLTTAAAQSLVGYLKATSDLNPVYARLRDAAWAEAQASGNLTPDPRLLANLDRVRSIPSRGKFAVVDAGDERLTMFDDGQPTDSMKIIVGTKELATPLVASMIYYVTFNPYWHAPDHLVRKIIAPTVLRQGMKYLKSHGYHVVDEWSESSKEIDAGTIDWKAAAAGTAHVLVQQDPGPLNSMGNLKFPFANPSGVYLHDTPGKELFAKQERHLSNGCVRLEDARRFGRWLLGKEPVAPSSDPEANVQLAQGVAIILTYLTAQVQDGKVIYLLDVYDWDRPTTQVAAAN